MILRKKKQNQRKQEKGVKRKRRENNMTLGENKKITLSDEQLHKFLNGVKIEVESSDQIVRVYNKGKYR